MKKVSVRLFNVQEVFGFSSEEQKETIRKSVLNNQGWDFSSAEIWEFWRSPFLCSFGKCKSCNDQGEKHSVVVAIPEPEGKPEVLEVVVDLFA